MPEAEAEEVARVVRRVGSVTGNDASGPPLEADVADACADAAGGGTGTSAGDEAGVLARVLRAGFATVVGGAAALRLAFGDKPPMVWS